MDSTSRENLSPPPTWKRPIIISGDTIEWSHPRAPVYVLSKGVVLRFTDANNIVVQLPGTPMEAFVELGWVVTVYKNGLAFPYNPPMSSPPPTTMPVSTPPSDLPWSRLVTDRRIKELQRSGRINISPYDEVNIQPVSYEVHLGDLYTVPQMRPGQMFVDPGTTRTLPHSEYISLPYRTGVFLLHPGKFILSHIAEHIKYSAGVAGFFHGKSSLGRLGLLVHVTAGLADPGWEGRLTVELKNLADYPIRLWRGMPIGQMVFEDLGEDVEVPYGSPQLGSHYQGDDQVRPAQALRLD